MVTVNIQGHGSFAIPANKLNELLTWLTTNSMPVEGSSNTRPGDTLLNG